MVTEFKVEFQREDEDTWHEHSASPFAFSDAAIRTAEVFARDFPRTYVKVTKIREDIIWNS